MNIEELKPEWERFGDVPVDNNDDLEEEFEFAGVIFPKGCDRFDVWSYFEELCPNGLVKDLMPWLENKNE